MKSPAEKINLLTAFFPHSLKLEKVIKYFEVSKHVVKKAKALKYDECLLPAVKKKLA